MAKDPFDFSDVFRDIEDKIDKYMKDGTTKETISRVIAGEVEDNVYAQYWPKEYIRRREAGGLSDYRNYEVDDIGPMAIMISNNTPGNAAYKPPESEGWDAGFINNIIEVGFGYHWTHSTIYAWEPYPRPFMEAAVNKYVDDYLLPDIHNLFFND